MAITLSMQPNGGVEVRQSFVRPAVYLDHWAIQRLCDKPALRRRFIDSLKQHNGTLVLSHITLAEFAIPEDPRHALEAEDLLEEVLPNLYFALFNLGIAIEQEGRPDAHLHPPPADTDLMAFLATRRPTTPKPLTAKGLITPIAEYRDRLGSTFAASKSQIAAKINEQKQDAAFVQRARNYRGAEGRSLSLMLSEQLLRPMFLTNTPANSNDASDLQHATIALAYCDFVLLDGKWKEHARQARERLAGSGLPHPIAQVYSDRGSDFEQFLGALESYVAKSPQAGKLQSDLQSD